MSGMMFETRLRPVIVPWLTRTAAYVLKPGARDSADLRLLQQRATDLLERAARDWADIDRSLHLSIALAALLSCASVLRMPIDKDRVRKIYSRKYATERAVQRFLPLVAKYHRAAKSATKKTTTTTRKAGPSTPPPSPTILPVRPQQPAHNDRTTPRKKKKKKKKTHEDEEAREDHVRRVHDDAHTSTWPFVVQLLGHKEDSPTGQTLLSTMSRVFRTAALGPQPVKDDPRVLAVASALVVAQQDLYAQDADTVPRLRDIMRRLLRRTNMSAQQAAVLTLVEQLVQTPQLFGKAIRRRDRA